MYTQLERTHHGLLSISESHLSSQSLPQGLNAELPSTACNTTYGCCGCDNCQGYNNLSNVPARLDSYRDYQIQLGLPPKVLWGTPQAFGNAEFWKQTPTPQEEVAMTMLSVNHGAKGIIMWTFPTTPGLTDVTSGLAKVLTGICSEYLLGADMVMALRVSGPGMLDASAWRVEDSVLLSIVNSDYQDMEESVTLDLPAGMAAKGIKSVLWGDGKWRLTNGDSATQIQRSGLKSLSTDIIILSLGLQLAFDWQDVVAEA